MATSWSASTTTSARSWSGWTCGGRTRTIPRGPQRLAGPASRRPRLGPPIYVPPPDPPDPDPVRGEIFQGAGTLPFGNRAFEAFEPNDLVLYVETRRAVVCGDTLNDRGDGLEVHPERAVQAVAVDDVVARLRPLLEPAGRRRAPDAMRAEPAGRAALERALSR